MGGGGCVGGIGPPDARPDVATRVGSLRDDADEDEEDAEEEEEDEGDEADDDEGGERTGGACVKAKRWRQSRQYTYESTSRSHATPKHSEKIAQRRENGPSPLPRSRSCLDTSFVARRQTNLRRHEYTRGKAPPSVPPFATGT